MCKILYIEALPVNEDTKVRLNETYLEVETKVKNSKLFKAVKFQDTTEYQLASNTTTNKAAKQINFINNLQKEYNANIIGKKTIEKNQYLVIDVRPLINTVSKKTNQVETTVDTTEKITLPDVVNLTLPIGIAGSGKSTWIKSLPKDTYTIISPDEIRRSLTGSISDQSKNIEVFKETDKQVIEAIKEGKQVVLDATNTRTDFRRSFLQTLRELFSNIRIAYKIIDSNPEVSKQRIKKDIESGMDRAAVPEEIVDKQYEQYLQTLEDVKLEGMENFDRVKGNNILYQKSLDEGSIASEKTIRDLAARMSHRIGVFVKFESDRTKNYKGKFENNVAYINLAYATLDTPIHEILGHPIIRTILKSKTELYNNLLKELEYGRGKDVLDRVKRDYVEKPKLNIQNTNQYVYNGITINGIENSTFNNLTFNFNSKEYYITRNGSFMEITPEGAVTVESISEELRNKAQEVFNITQDIIKNGVPQGNYTLGEQQEEAIVELLGLMTAEKLDNIKDGKLISLLKRLLKEMKQFIRSLINQKEVEIDKLHDNMTINDLADLLAYSNSKIILPGNEVIYTTPDNQTFKTYQEASNHISKLSNSTEEIDLESISIRKNDVKSIEDVPNNFHVNMGDGNYPVDVYILKDVDGYWYEFNYTKDPNQEEGEMISEEVVLKMYKRTLNQVNDFINRNKEFEQSKEIIEEWKKVNDIVYNPEEVYSRGQGFYSVVGAYSQFDVSLMFQNLLHHIEDNKKAGGHFAISAFTKPIDKNISHLEGGGGKIKFVIYPKSEDILWATNKDAYSGSVWDAGEKINKDKKSELLGVSYTKYPSLNNLNSVQPNLASIIDNLGDHHNELGIVLNNNFRMEYDEDVPYQIKKIIDANNKILDEKFGKIKKPDVSVGNSKITKYVVYDLDGTIESTFDTKAEAIYHKDKLNIEANLSAEDLVLYGGFEVGTRTFNQGIQPTKTYGNLKKSISNIQQEITKPQYYFERDFIKDGDNYYKLVEEYTDEEDELSTTEPQVVVKKVPITKDEYEANKPKEKEYTQQALINTKIAALKEVAKKYPRILIRSEVIKIKNNVFEKEIYSVFQKVENILKDSNKALKEKLNLTDEDINSLTIEELNKLKNCYL